MAKLVAKQDGNLTATTTWYDTDSGSVLMSEAGNTALTTSYVVSSNFQVTAGDYIGVCVKIALRAASPTGTMSIKLYDVTNVTQKAEQTVDVADIAYVFSATDYGAWLFIKFTSAVTLAAATNYRIEAKTSSSSQVNLYRDSTAGNWSRMMVKDANPASVGIGDEFFVISSLTDSTAPATRTVTMDSTALTDYGAAPAAGATATANPAMHIANSGVLNWGTTASTNYRLQLSGNLDVVAGGTWKRGDGSGTAIPDTSTAYLVFDPGADGDYGIRLGTAASFYECGSPRTAGRSVVQCLLNTDEAVNSTSLGVNTDTGWLDNDEIVVAATSRTPTETEKGALNGAAGASSLTVDGFGGVSGGLAYAHSGTSPTQAEVILLTRNVRTYTTDAAKGWWLLTPAISAGANIVFDVRWTELFYGSGTTTTTLLTLQLTATFSTQAKLWFCALHTCRGGGILLGASCLNVSIKDTVMYDLNTTTISITSLNLQPAGTSISTLNACEVIRTTVLQVKQAATSVSAVSLGRHWKVEDVRCASLNHNAASNTICVSLGDANQARQIGNVDGLVVHSSRNIVGPTAGALRVAMAGIPVTASEVGATVKNILVWRNDGEGILFSLCFGTALTGVSAFGNRYRNVQLSSCNGLEVDFDRLYAESSYSSSSGISVGSQTALATFRNADLSSTPGGAVHTVADIVAYTAGIAGQLTFENCKFGASTLISGFTQNQQGHDETSYFRFLRYNQTDGDNRTYSAAFIAQTDSVIYDSAAPSTRITPSTTTIASIVELPPAAVSDGQAATYSLKCRYSKSTDAGGANYNGVAPKLYVRANAALGITSDTLLATHSGAADWVTMSGSTAAVQDSGVLEFYLKLDGTAGWVNVDTVSVTVA